MEEKMLKILKYYLVGLIIGAFIFSGGYFILRNDLSLAIAIKGLQSQISDLQEQDNQFLDNDIELAKNTLLTMRAIKTLSQINQTVDVKLLLNSNVFVRGITGMGSGTVIKKTENRMYVLTCYHVVESTVILNKLNIPMGVTVGYSKRDELNKIAGLIVYGAKIIKSDKEQDLALLEVSIVDDELEARPIAENEPEKGDTVYSVGNPLGMLRTISKGILANKIEGSYITDSTTTFGNSGGGLFNIKGELIGVPSEVSAYPSGIDKDGKDTYVPETSLGSSIPLFVIKTFLEGVEF
jgi:S1-C subfamily serine protease